MPYSFRDWLGYWLERRAWTHRLLLRYDGVAPNGRMRYINRINRHCVLKGIAV